MKMLDSPTIESMYQTAGLTPVLVLLGGSTYFNYIASTSDEDYFGYHLEDTHLEDPPREIVAVGDMEGDYICSRPLNTISDLLLGPKQYQSVYNLIAWIGITPILETPEAITFRDTIVQPLFIAERSLFEDDFDSVTIDLNNISIESSGLFDKRFNNWSQTIHMFLMTYHLKKTGEIEVDYPTLTSAYNITPENIVSILDLQGQVP